MALTLDQILGYRAMTSIAQSVINGVPDNLLPPSFMSTTERVPGNRATVRMFESSRQNAQGVPYGNDPIRRQLKQIAEKPVVLWHSFQEAHFDMTILSMLENFDNPEHQELGRQVISQQSMEFAREIRNVKMSMIYSLLANGKIWFDSNYNLLPSASGAESNLTIDFSVPSGNKDQIGGIIGTTWATTTVDIPGDIKAIKNLARQTSGHPLKYAFYGTNVFSYLANNDFCENVINGSPQLASTFASYEIPPGFLGLTWIPVSEAFFADSTGTNQTFFGADTVVFTPEPDPSWYSIIEGSYAVPKSVNLGSDAMAVSSNFDNVYGDFSFARISMPTPGINYYMGTTCLPVLKVPAAIFIADVVP
jgi:hypothetical protein